MKSRILVTGGTGYLGRHVVPLLLEHFEIDLLSRHPPSAKSVPSAPPQTKSAPPPQVASATPQTKSVPPPQVASATPQMKPSTWKLNWLQGDLTKWNGGLEVEKLKGRYACLLHMGALYDLRATPADLMLHNVAGTQNAMTIAQKADIPFFVNTSTVAVTANLRNFSATPYDLSSDSPYPDAYAESKAVVESQVRSWGTCQVGAFGTSTEPVHRLNLRMGVLVANSSGGEAIPRIDGPYHLVHAFQRVLPLLKRIPGPLWLPGSSRRLPLVPVDIAAKAVADLLIRWVGRADFDYLSLHLTPTKGPTALELYESLLNYLGVEKDIRIIHRLPAGAAAWGLQRFLDLPRAEVLYMLRLPNLDSRDTIKLLGEHWCPPFADYAHALWKGYTQYVSHS
ncbi:MAG: hypothetical protein C5B49_04215 [Bdellovibrio sp.]|nr:MAG: hypothetical protein C5B49_04215 [Bdellovibrio sp.]